ncbi:hypothetical protein GGF32_004221 [Allomyces javanicus]|nr:hypothetical protein GGF32_004221 [Allomyces javanicus]
MATNDMEHARRPGVKKFLHVDVFLEELQRTLQHTWRKAEAFARVFWDHHYHRSVRYRKDEDMPHSIRTLMAMTQTLRALDPDSSSSENTNSANNASLAWVFELHPALCGQLQFVVLQLGIDTIAGPKLDWDI